jgi:hypothetical protein
VNRSARIFGSPREALHAPEFIPMYSLLDGKQLTAVFRIKPLRRLHCSALRVFCRRSPNSWTRALCRGATPTLVVNVAPGLLQPAQTSPQAIKAAAAIPAVRNGFLRTRATIRAPNRMLVSRKLATRRWGQDKPGRQQQGGHGKPDETASGRPAEARTGQTSRVIARSVVS